MSFFKIVCLKFLIFGQIWGQSQIFGQKWPNLNFDPPEIAKNRNFRNPCTYFLFVPFVLNHAAPAGQGNVKEGVKYTFQKAHF